MTVSLVISSEPQMQHSVIIVICHTFPSSLEIYRVVNYSQQLVHFFKTQPVLNTLKHIILLMFKLLLIVPEILNVTNFKLTRSVV